MIEAILLAIAALYLVEYTIMRIGQARMRRRAVRVVPETWPRVTVLVAARNEEANIEACLQALLAQDYPPERMQIIAVNDESEDRTLELMCAHADANPGRLTIVSTVAENSHARGKARAIAQGMDVATGEIVLLTDADCTPASTWVRAVVEHFHGDVAVCGGFTVISAHDLLGSMQQLDWVHLQTLGSAALGLGFPVGVIGNNFSFRRSAYEAVGGYRAVPFTVTEDFALYQAMTRNGAGAVFPCSREALVYTNPCASLGEVMRQKQRWARGGTENTVPGYTLFIVAVLIMFAFTLAPFVSLTAWAVVWGVKIFCDLLVLVPSFRILRMTGQLKWFPAFEFYFVVQISMIPLLLMSRTVVWKGREYR
ncbi:MAG TPA: glycosyltransferase [Candidatus Kapabacteria bacterium]|nr:glycosyltransferase [Candidatus Kapabacteria bacterium]